MGVRVTHLYTTIIMNNLREYYNRYIGSRSKTYISGYIGREVPSSFEQIARSQHVHMYVPSKAGYDATSQCTVRGVIVR